MQQRTRKTRPDRPRSGRNVCVYCGSNVGGDPAFAAAARALGATLADHGIGLVFGGGGRGLMGEMARSALAHGGRVVGIIPEFLAGPEQAVRQVDELVVTATMHERKLMMFERSDAFIALPGGIGTLEEFVEQLTWNQIGQHDKPIVLLDIGGYWEPLTALFRHMTAAGFIRGSLETHFTTVDRVDQIMPFLAKRLRGFPGAVAPARPSARKIPPEKL